ncbi:transglycosylase SLT domain-containing protein [Shigella flexneri]
MQTESSFNPYAVSRSDALGLMQVVHTAGKDVFRSQGKSGTPSRSFCLILPAISIPHRVSGDAEQCLSRRN